MIDRRPAVIVQPADADDVAPAIQFARASALEISVRGAGHNIAGNAVCNGGMMIDFSSMRNVRVDAAKKRAYVDPGATLADFDSATQQHGLATPVGINSTTGIAGLTLGGGFGWLTRKHGLTIDNLISAEVVTADGKRLRASEQDNAELFWALRGGGGNFGVVTEFEFALHPVGPEILAGLIVFPFAQAKQVLTRYSQFANTATEDLSVWVVLRQAPPLPFSSRERSRSGSRRPADFFRRRGRGRAKAGRAPAKLRRRPRRARRRATLYSVAKGFRSPTRARSSKLLEIA
jgi:FAD/FMN-containing dehydrogenase